MKKVLLTGSTGFIGAHCIEPLKKRGYEVVATSSKPHTKFPLLNLFDPHSVEIFLQEMKFTHLLHLAWYTDPPHYWNSSLNLSWHQASIHLLDVFYRNQGRRVVIAGTCAEYEWGHLLCREWETPCHPNSLYGTTKLALFLLSQKMTSLAQGSLAWGRIFHLYGPNEGMGRIIPIVIRGLLKKEEVPCTDGKQIRDYLHVKDVGDALAALLDSGVEGPVNIGSGVQLKIRTLIEKIAQKIGNKDLLRLGSLPSRLSDPLLLVPCTKRLNEEVLWKPKIDLENGLEEVINWWKNEIYN